MILSSADILRVLGGSEIIRLSAKLKITDGKPLLSGAEGVFIYIERFPVLDEFEATWLIYVEADEEDDLIVAELKRLLPKVKVERGLMTKVTTTDFRSEHTQKAPEAAPKQEAQVDMSSIEERFQELVEDIQDRMLLVSSGRPGKDGRDGVNGRDGRNGVDIVASETDLEDLRNVQGLLPKEKGQVLTWDGVQWTNLFVPQLIQSIGGGGGGGGGTASVIISADPPAKRDDGSSLQEGDVWFETDTDRLHVYYQSQWVLTGVDSIDDLSDVDTSTSLPQESQSLVWDSGAQQWIPRSMGNGSALLASEWKFSNQTTGAPANGYLYFNNADPALSTEIFINEENWAGNDVSAFLQALLKPGTRIYIQEASNSANAALFTVTSSPVDLGTFQSVQVVNDVSQGAFTNNRLCAFTVIGGSAAGTVSVIDDLLDVDTSTVAPQVGDILKWDGSQWVPDATAGTGIEEAPVDGKYYVRQNGAWIDLATALSQVVTPDSNVDGADFTQQVTTAVNSITYDGGDFTTGATVATDNTFLDGEVFSPAFDDTIIDGGTASV